MKDLPEEEIKRTQHVPVLLHDVITILAVRETDYVIDGTLGGGGYTKAIVSHLGSAGMLLGLDADQDAYERVHEEFKRDARIKLIVGNFRDIDVYVAEANLPKVDKIVLDLGLSSYQLEQKSGRGFSFLIDEPLKMTFSHNQDSTALTAWHVVNEWEEESLADIIFGFGGETFARKIAYAICEARKKKIIDTSKELADIVEQTVHKKGKVHPATKTFQAIRIAVNDELGALEEVLEKGKALLSSKGRMVVVTFHSLEDRIVKQAFLAWEKEGVGKRITKHPIVPSREECLTNRRSRSAKLRCFEKA